MWTKLFKIPDVPMIDVKIQLISKFNIAKFCHKQLKWARPQVMGWLGGERVRVFRNQNKTKWSREKRLKWKWNDRARALLSFDPSGKNPRLWKMWRNDVSKFHFVYQSFPWLQPEPSPQSWTQRHCELWCGIFRKYFQRFLALEYAW